MAREPHTVRVAVIGTGLAGLATAYLLAQPNEDARSHPAPLYDIHLFEKSDKLGMDAASLSLKQGHEQGQDDDERVDVPMRSINGGSHSRVKKLYERLGVPLVESEFSYSFSTLFSPPSRSSRPPSSSRSPSPLPPPLSPTPDSLSPSPTRTPPPRSRSRSRGRKPSPSPTQSTHLLYSGASGLRWPPFALPSRIAAASLAARAGYLFSLVPLALSYLYLLVLAFLYISLGLARPPPLSGGTWSDTLQRRWVQAAGVAGEPLDRWLERHRVPRRMRETTRVLMAAVATVGTDEAGRMPVGEILEYITSTFLAPHYLIHPTFGVRGIVARLVAPLPPSNVHLGVSVARIEARPDSGEYAVVFTPSGSSGEETLAFDHIVFATQADAAATLLSTLSPSPSPSPSLAPDRALNRTLAALRSFTYARTLVVTHICASSAFLPAEERDRRDLNLAVFAPGAGAAEGEKGEKEGGEGDECMPPSSVQTTHILRPSPSPSPSPSHPSSPPDDDEKRPPAPAAALVLQTTNPLSPVPPQCVLSTSWFTRAVVNARSQGKVPLFAAGGAEGGVQGLPLGLAGEKAGGVWFAGSYAAPGIPLLEGCVSSAEVVVEGIRMREAERERGTREKRRGEE
ncbi:hypothetical protein JCM10207_000204 [Rhodosporidiobolus poonsookiae]